ncbi:hypothetical protein [Gymnodinialimonas ceratoperidinii]|uniref:Uncharacterized protein n=1 Tax=Gymnodinialimonas ceratoperidinii TaxID=2856823 RepID=A0A8F6TZE7_9RHOB|nr:hypothetical protein [Gymnodinialimonas ceratoperidinii]QXT40743.1 hypothetical protein KYE46_05775 [Gymnodinialimonas ceratoperidinii]
MLTSFKIPALALTLALGAAPAFAQETVELVTGIGFGETQVEATQNSVRAWIIEGTRLYGSADFNTALRGSIDCNQTPTTGGGEGGATTLGVGVSGDATGEWACTVTGLPLSAIPQ